MGAAVELWIVIVAVGLLNFLSRLSFIALFARRQMPGWLARTLKYVPAAMLTALVVPMILAPNPAAPGVIHANPRVLAALLAGVVAYVTRSTLATLAAGMAALWVLQAVLR
jgi:branched-subunit amino acid transport protein